MPRTGENIYYRRDGRWEGRLIQSHNETGKAKYIYFYGKTYREVKQKRQLALLKQFRPQLKSEGADQTFKCVISRWLQNTRIRVKESTFAQYTRLVNTHILPHLGKYPVEKMNTELIEQYLYHLLIKGRGDGHGGLARKTVQDILVVLKSMFNYVKDPGVCDLSSIKLKAEEKETRVLKQPEQTKLNTLLMKDTDLTKLGVLLNLYTGIRIGELCALRWENVCLSEGTLFIISTMQRLQILPPVDGVKTKVVITPPKSRQAIRSIPIPEFLLPILRQFIGNPKAFILTGDENRYIEPRTMQNRFKAYMKRLGLEGVNYHALRHTFITRCVELGFDIKSLSEVAGHANVNITLSRYVHSSFELKRKSMDKLSFLMSHSPSAPPSVNNLIA